MNRIAMFSLMVFCAAQVSGAPVAKSGKSNFPRVPVQALKALKAQVGKPFSSGWVFIDGKYVPPPYKVERYGTALRINGQQVTGEMVPWEEFLKTQPNVKVTRNEPAAGAPAPEAAPEPEPEPEIDDSWESSLDDLFDDEPAAKKPAGKKSGGGYKPRVKKPTVTFTYSLEGEFVPNDKSRELLNRINTARTKLDSHLRSGGLCYFSSRYSPVRVDGRAASQMMDKLPALMKQSASEEALAQAIRSNGFTYLSPQFIADLYKNKIDYLPLMQRNKTNKDRTQW